MKYPRTYHLPFSPGATSDDKRLADGWFEKYLGREVVITEKLDGENIHMNQKDCYARSDGAPTRSPWSRNIWDSRDGLYWKVKSCLGETETIFGENLYGEHSIKYDRLPFYFHLFAVSDDRGWYSWDDVSLMANLLGIPTVPVLWRGIFNTEESLKALVEKLVQDPSVYGDTREGVVVRITESFPIEDFPKYVCKWIRAGHVQTDQHWTKTWKKAELYYETD